MYYEINISKEGRHYFATAPRSITYIKDLQVKLADIMKRFPKEEGFEIMVFKYPEVSTIENIDEIMAYK